MTQYLIWSVEHCAWWKPGRWGYTTATHAAGRFTYTEAEAIIRDANFGGEEEEIAVVAPSRLRTTQDLIESGLQVPWAPKEAGEAFAPSPADAASVKVAGAAEEKDERLPTVDYPKASGE